MKTAYKIALVAVSIMVLSWFLPWLYSLILPETSYDPFVAYSPVSDTFIITERVGDGDHRIYDLDSAGVSTGAVYTKENRDSLLPQIYFSQLIARQQLPDSMNGKELSMKEFRRNQWVFNSSPRDINKRKASVYMIMESMPVRFELEDPKEVFRLNGQVEFVDMATNTVNQRRSNRFTQMFNDKGFKYPVRDLSANVTTRKAYDEGYLMADAEGSLYHVKMQAGRPYMTKVDAPDSVKVAHVYMMENSDRTHLGLVTDENNNLYALEHDDYKLVQLPVGKFDPTKEQLTVMKNMFNWVVKVSCEEYSRWTAFDSDDYHLLGNYAVSHAKTPFQVIAEYIFPFELSFTSYSDSYAYPRIESVSWKAIWLNLLLSVLVVVILRKKPMCYRITAGLVTVVFGIFSFIPYLLIKD
ncbi:MAG: DUF4857 domain-containing protein [Muribaculum sp.]|nr:DUF4857 domain-containing protein [Muribaculum sp.]